MSTLTDWDFFNRNVQSGLLEGRYMNAAFTLLAAGPPRLAATNTGSGADVELGDIAFPMGIIQSVNLAQNSQWLRIWEVGSERSYFARGRTAGQLGLGRIMYHGPSLLRVLYAYLKSETGSVKFDQLYANFAQVKLNTSGQGDGKSEYKVAPGYDNLWINLASDVFSQPIGMLVYMRDSNEDTVGAFYVEYCVVANHGWATDAGGTIMSENAAIMFEKIVPIDVKAVALIKNSDDVQSIVGANVIGSAA